MTHNNELIAVRVDRSDFDKVMANDQHLSDRILFFAQTARSVYNDAREYLCLAQDSRAALRALERQIAYAQGKADAFYLDYLSNLRVCKHEFRWLDVLELFERLKANMPVFAEEQRYQEFFFQQFDLHFYLYQAWIDDQIGEGFLDGVIDGSHTGETEFGINGGLEILQLGYPIENDDIQPPYGAPFLYILMGDDDPLYVGQTISLINRIKSHFHEKKKQGIKWLIAIRLRDESKLLYEEQRLIQRINPPLNKTFVRPGRTA